MAANSSSVSGPFFCSTVVGTPSLPTSCSMPAYRIASTRLLRMPTSWAIMAEPRATRSLCPRVYRSLVSTAWHSAAMVAA